MPPDIWRMSVLHVHKVIRLAISWSIKHARAPMARERLLTPVHEATTYTPARPMNCSTVKNAMVRKRTVSMKATCPLLSNLHSSGCQSRNGSQQRCCINSLRRCALNCSIHALQTPTTDHVCSITAISMQALGYKLDADGAIHTLQPVPARPCPAHDKYAAGSLHDQLRLSI